MGQTTSDSLTHRNDRDQATPSTSHISTPDAFGLLELACGNNPDVDIVALHGLDGHRESSWTAENGVLWLKDLLAAKIPQARIFSYGYNANTRGQDQLSTASLHAHSMNLIAHLAAKRRSTSTEQRPIIFIAHSLGGILLKDALIYAHSCGKNNLPSYKAVEVSTSGILFFGTPHQGSKGADLLTVVLNVLSAFGKGTTKIIKNIRNDSEVLEKQMSQYQAISANYDTKFYFEAYKTPIGPFTKVLLVPRTSAVVLGAVNAEMIPLNKNHVNMVKFESAEDGAFELVSSHLVVMVAEASQRIAERWKAQMIPETVTLEGQPTPRVDSMPTVSDDDSAINLKINQAPLPTLPYQPAGESFVGREDVLAWIHHTFEKQHKVALYGIGGIGKTGIAVQYVYTHRHDYSIVFWINGDTLETTTSGFITMAQQLVQWKSKGSVANSSKPGRDYSRIAIELGLDNLLDNRGKVSKKAEDRQDIIDAVKAWLSEVTNENWLMVFDNVDDLDSFDLTTFFPVPLLGRILITSRKQDSRSLGVGYEITALGEDDGVKLLLEKSCGGEADSEAFQIVRTLEGLPLAIELAGAYIAALQLSFKTYIATMNEPWKHVFTENIRPYGRSLVAAWETSFQAIEARSPSAADMFLICAFLGNEDIPELLFQGKLGATVGIVNKALKELFAFSLVKRGLSEASFSIHPLVHAWARERLNEDQKAEKVQEMVVLLGHTISQMPVSWNHTSIAANYALEYCLSKLHAKSDSVIFKSLENIAQREKGKLLQEMFRIALAATESIEGPDSVQTFTALELLGLSHFGYMYRPIGQFLQNALQKRRRMNRSPLTRVKQRLRGEVGRTGNEKHRQVKGGDTAKRHLNLMEQREEGERLVRRALEGREKIQGLDHVDTLATVEVLAHLIWDQRRFEEAAKLEQRALEGREKILGSEHRHTLNTVSYLAASMHDQGRFEEAQKLHRRALEGCEKLLGINHADTLASVHDLAVSIHAQGRFEEAEKLFRRALEGREKFLGINHVDTFQSVRELAVSIHAQGRFEEAEKLFQRALEGLEKLLGINHADTFQSVHALAVSIHAQGRFEEAEKLFRCALEGNEKLLGINHADTLFSVHSLAVSIHDLAASMHDQGRFEEAQKLHRRALEGREKLLGINHADTFQSVHALAMSIHAQGRFEEAEKLFRRALEGREKLLGINHVDTFKSVHGLAVSIHNQGRFEEAEKLFRRALEGREKFLGINHADTFNSVHGLAVSIHAQGRFEEAEKFFRCALEGRETLLGLNHADTFNSVHGLAVSIHAQGRFEEAENLHRRALERREKLLGINHADTLKSIQSLVVSIWAQGRYAEVEELDRRTVAGYENLLGLDHVNTLKAVHNLTQTMCAQGKFHEAESLGRRAVEGRTKILGVNHEDTLQSVTYLAQSIREQGRFEEAKKLEQWASDGRKSAL